MADPEGGSIATLEASPFTVVDAADVTEIQTGPDEPAAPAAAPEPLDSAYVSRANIFNLTEEDLRSVPRPVVERILAGADRALLDAFRRDRQTPYQAPPTAPPAPQLDAPAFAPFDLKFDPADEIAEPLTKTLAAMNAHYAAQLKQLHETYQQKFQGVDQFTSQVRQQNHYAALDRYIDSLGPEWSATFGKGPTLSKDTRSQEFLKSDQLGMAAVEMMQAHLRVTGRALSEHEALDRARAMLFHEQVSAAERAAAEAKRKELAASASVRPRSSSSGGNQTGGLRQRAEAMVASMRR
jgi:hypothetical protein